MARRLPIPTATGLLYVPHDCIMHLQAEGSYTLVRCTSSLKYLVCDGLGTLERVLPPHSFFRCHRSHVINLALVQQLVVHGGYRVCLTAGHTVEVARRRLAALKEALARV